MQKLKNASLEPYNTFGFDLQASELWLVESVDDLHEALNACRDRSPIFLGGGSNILITEDLNRPVIVMQIPGISVVDESDDKLVVESGGGVVWNDLVQWSVNRNLGGIENLSLIPGSVGAAPMQNIGAYGVEIKDTFVKLKAMRISDGSIVEFEKDECEFGYRTSIFKTSAKDQYVIFSVQFELTKNPSSFSTHYGAIEDELERLGIENISVKDVSNAVINIRQSKLPDPKVIGNSGSFFKNPVISTTQFEKVKQEHPEIHSYPVDESHVKVAAGWLIDRAGWKGKDLGGYGVHDKQALVLVNRGGGSGQKILALSEDIIQDVNNKFGIQLEREVNLLP